MTSILFWSTVAASILFSVALHAGCRRARGYHVRW